MLEVHPPEHAPHSVRDFLLHIVTITIGLLIALGLEAVVEWRHHVHLRHEAEHNLRREIEANRKDLQSVLAAIPEEQQNMTVMLHFLQQREQNQEVDVKTLNVGLRMLTPHDASWQTASVTNALSYMEYDEVQRYASAYSAEKQMEAVQAGALQTVIALEALVATGDPTHMKPVEATAAIPQVRSMMANLYTIRELGRQLDASYAEALKEP